MKKHSVRTVIAGFKADAWAVYKSRHAFAAVGLGVVGAVLWLAVDPSGSNIFAIAGIAMMATSATWLTVGRRTDEQMNRAAQSAREPESRP